jgi:hypothetical protein
MTPKRFIRHVSSAATDLDIDRAVSRVYEAYGVNWSSFVSADQKTHAQNEKTMAESKPLDELPVDQAE